MKRSHGLIALALLVLVLFSPFWLLGRVFVPEDFLNFVYPWKGVVAQEQVNQVQNPELLDIPTEFFPIEVFVNQRLKQGEIPLWNPQMFCGHPLFASGQSGLFYPPKLLLHWLFEADVARTLSMLLHTLAAAWFMFFLLELTGFGVPASTFGGAVWILNGQMIGWLEYDHIMLMATYVPLMLLTFEHGYRGRWWCWPLLGVSGALCLHSGHLQLAFYCGLVLAAYAASAFYRGWQPKKFLAFLGSGIIVVLLSAPTLLPFAELLSNSARQDLSFSQIQAMAGSIPTLLLTLVLPDALGHPAGEFLVNRVDDNLIFAEFANYFGVIPLLFAISLGWRHSRQRLRWEGRFWGLFAVLMLLFAAATPVYRLFVLVVPPLSKAIPGRSLLAFGFAAAWLAAAGLDEWLGNEERRETFLKVCKGYLGAATLFWLGSASLLLMAPALLLDRLKPFYGTTHFKLPVAGPGENFEALLLAGLIDNYLWNFQFLIIVAGLALFLWKRHWSILVLATALELAFSFWSINPTVPRSQVLPTTPSIEYLQSREGHFRVEKYSAGFYDLLTPYDLQVVTGYDSVIQRPVYEAFRLTDPEETVNMRTISLRDFSHPFFAHTGMKYLMIGPKKPSFPEHWPTVFQEEVQIVENPDVLPRAYLASEARIARGTRAALEAMEEPSFRPGQTVLLEESLSVPLSAAEGSVKIVSYRPNQVILETEAEGPKVLVLNDAHYPGWQAVVDGEAAELLRANAVFRGVLLDEGRHTVEFVFRPHSLRNGLNLALTGLGLALLWLVIAVFRREDVS